MDEAVAQRQLLTDPFLVRGIRPYQFGDPVRDIHWPASARTGETHVRLHDYSAQSRLLVVLNMEIRADQWGDRITEQEQNTIEYGISLAATLCLRALRQGSAAGFAANMPVSDDEGCAFVPPANDAAADERLLCAMARLKVVRRLRFATFLDSLHDCRDMNILVLSCCDSTEIQSALQALRSRNNQVFLYRIQGGDGIIFRSCWCSGSARLRSL